jgi:CRISPR system Cascade subunit CasE
MYLSLLKLNPSFRKTRELLINPYILHQAVYRAFPDKEDGGPGRVLYRIDQNQRSGGISLLVQSKKEMDWEKAHYLDECLSEKVEYKPWAPAITDGQRLYFRLRANPSIKKQVEGKKNGYRLGLLREEDQLRWLRKKAAENGFTVETCRVIPEGIIYDEKGQADKSKLRHYAVRFEGVLRVTDTDVFNNTLTSGIGPAKGFGFGLLSIAPVRGN